MTSRERPAAVIRGNSVTQSEEADELYDSFATRFAGESPSNDRELTVMKKMRKKLKETNEQRVLAQLIAILEKIRVDRDAEFSTESSIMTMSIRSKEIDSLSLEKSFKVADSKLYTSTNQKNYETFIRECQRTFDIKLITYAADRAKILYVENFIDETSAND